MKEFRVIYTTDVHGYFFQTDYISNDKSIGLISLLKDIKKDSNTILIDCGDILQGSPFVQYLQKEIGSFEVASKIMNDLNYDYVTLGNHDFNFGVKKLKTYVDNLQAKVICSNVTSLSLNNLFSSSIKVLENGLRIGIVGAVTDYVNIWDTKETLEGMNIKSAFEELKKEISLIKPQVDFIVCIYHGGFDENSNKSFGENVATFLCSELEIDLLLTGHQHLSISNKNLNNTHVVQSSFNSKMYGEVNIKCFENKFKIESKNVIHNEKENSIIENKYLNINKKVNNWLEKQIGYLNEEIKETNPLELITNGWRYADLCNKIIIDITKADISCISLTNNPYPLSNKITIKDIVSVCPFSNTISVIEVTKEILKQALEVVASYYCLNESEITINSLYTKDKLTLFNYDFYYGIEYCFDLTKEIGNRVISITKNNIELNDKEIYKLAVTSYRKTGSGGYDMFTKCNTVLDYHDEIQSILINHFEQNEIVNLPKKSEFKILK